MRSGRMTAGAISALALLTVVTTSVVVAEEPHGTARGECPSVQMISVNDVADSSLGQMGGGFLSQVSSPVLSAANGNQLPSAALAAGFEVPSASETSAAPTITQPREGWVSAGGANTTTTKTREGWVRSTSETASSATAESRAVSTTAVAQPAVPAVGNTVVSVESTDDTRPYLPGVTGPDVVPTYEESIAKAITDIETVLTEIDSRCPSTKVVLLGVGQGAQAASAVSKKIGAGEVFPAAKVLGVSLFADPSRNEDQPVVASGGSAPAGASTFWDAEAAPGAGVATVTGQGDTSEQTYGQVSDRTVSWCTQGDTHCALPAGAPLRTLVANTAVGTDKKSPDQALRYLADTLGPAVVLGSVETLAQDVNFGRDGFTFSEARSPQTTLIGRIAAESGRTVPQTEFQERLLAAGMQLGGMALAAGATVVKEVIQPENIAQIAAASAVSPAAGAAAALLIAGGAAVDLVSSRTMTTGAARIASEAQALGIEDEGFAEAAVQAAIGGQVSKSAGTYSKTAVTKTGQSATDATTDWLLDVVSQEIGKELGSVEKTQPSAFNANASQAALREVS